MTSNRHQSAGPCAASPAADAAIPGGVPGTPTPTGIDIRRERLIPLGDVPDRLPLSSRGKKVHRTAVHRWTEHGLRGVRLEYLQVGRRRCTSVEALQRFLERSTAARATTCHGAATTVTSRSPRQAATRQAEKERATTALRQLLRGAPVDAEGRGA